MGKGKDTSQAAGGREYQSRPLRSLRDPAEFAPPPRRTDYSGNASLPIARMSDRGAVGETSSQSQAQARQEQGGEEEAEENSTRPAPPGVPFRANTTGLSTDHLPSPPIRKLHQSGANPATAPAPTAPAPTARPKPSLPPRLPPRQNSSAVEHSVSPPPPPPPVYTQTAEAAPEQESYLNQGSLNRLGSAGVTVPGLNIGESSNPWQNEASSTASGPVNPQLSELQSRFSKMSTSSQNAEVPAQGTSFAQKQAALKTAGSFRNDPSSVSLADARSAASTANNFRQRHGDQVASGWKSANGLNQKYGITNKVNSYASSASPAQLEGGEPALRNPVTLDPSVGIEKKKPPPPPSKRRDLSGLGSGTLEPPPPLPLASKPRF